MTVIQTYVPLIKSTKQDYNTFLQYLLLQKTCGRGAYITQQTAAKRYIN